MRTAQRHCEFVADFLCQSAGLGKAQMVRVAGFATADEAGLFCNEPQVLLEGIGESSPAGTVPKISSGLLGSRRGPCFQTRSRATSIFSDELDSGLFEGALYVFKRTRIRLPCSAFKVRDGLRGGLACL